MSVRKLVVVLVVVFLGGGIWLWHSLRNSGSRTSSAERLDEDCDKIPASIPLKVLPSEKGENGDKLPKRNRRARRIVIEEPMTDADRKLYDDVQDALDKEDFKLTVKCAERACKSLDSRVRLNAVQALSWFGEKSLAELAPMMGDPDEDVAEAAQTAWELGLAEVESAAERVELAKMALAIISDPNALEMIGGQFSNAASELIDGEEDEGKAATYRTDVVQAIVDMMGDGSNGARTAAAKELYESITCNEWISVSEAERYLSNPDDYEPPEIETGEADE